MIYLESIFFNDDNHNHNHHNHHKLNMLLPIVPKGFIARNMSLVDFDPWALFKLTLHVDEDSNTSIAGPKLGTALHFIYWRSCLTTLAYTFPC